MVNFRKLLTPNIYTKHKKFVWFYSIIVLYSMIANFHPFYNPLIVTFSILSIFGYITINSSVYTSVSSRNDFIIFMGGYGIIYLISALQGWPVVNALWIVTLFGGTFLFLRRNIQLSIFNVFIKLYCCLMVLSIIEYTIFLITGFHVVLSSVERSLAINSYTFDMTYFNFLMHPIEITRFQSLLHEPGDIGSLNGLLLFGLYHKTDYRKFELPVIIVSGLMAMSIAFVVFLLIFLVSNAVKLNFKVVITSAIMILIIGFGFRAQVEKAIIYRLTERGIDQRSDDMVVERNMEALDHFQFLGRGYGAVSRDTGATGAGAHEQIYDFGWISILILSLSYYTIFKRNFVKMNYYALLFLFVFALNFYQRQNIYDISIVMAFILPSLIDREKYNHLYR